MFGYSRARAAAVGICLSALLGAAPQSAHAQSLQVAATAGVSATETEIEPPPATLRSDKPADSVPGTLHQKPSGLTLLCNFSARLFMITADGSNTPSQTALQGGVFGGYKLGRWLVGLGFDLSNFDTEIMYSDGKNSARAVVANTGFVFSPGAQVAILRSSDQRLELIGAAQLGLGSIVARNYQDPELAPELQTANDQKTFYLQYRLAPGLRVWALPQLAFNLLSGISGDHLFTFINNPSGNRTEQRSTAAFYVNLGAMGVF